MIFKIVYTNHNLTVSVKSCLEENMLVKKEIDNINFYASGPKDQNFEHYNI